MAATAHPNVSPNSKLGTIPQVDYYIAHDPYAKYTERYEVTMVDGSKRNAKNRITSRLMVIEDRGLSKRLLGRGF